MFYFCISECSQEEMLGHLNRGRSPREDVPTVTEQDQVSSLLYVNIHMNFLIRYNVMSH